ncbi:hypothetical protein Tco_1163743 [Tanacetum coccineum]
MAQQTPHAKPWSNELKAHSGQRLSEDICQLILSPHKIQFNHSFLYLFSNEMVPDIDVLRPRVMYIVAAEGDGTLVVTIQSRMMCFYKCLDNLHDLHLRMRGLRLISSTHAHSKNKVEPAGSEVHVPMIPPEPEGSTQGQSTRAGTEVLSADAILLRLRSEA